MLKTIQIIALAQGVFLLFILFRNRKKYRRVTLWLLFCSIVAVLLFLMGDDENNIFLDDVDLFLLDSSLFITFLFLFFSYLKSGREKFHQLDYLFFVPNLVYLAIEVSEFVVEDGNFLVQAVELLTELTFICYLLYIIFYPIVNKTKSWLFYFAIPMALLLGMGYLNDILSILGREGIVLSSSDDYESYLLLIVAFLFYFITFNLINNPARILPGTKVGRCKNSNLKPELIDTYRQVLINVMEKDQLFMDNGLSIHTVAQKIAVPRQYISEVLNLHMNTSFQDFTNGYRIKEFLRRLQSEKYENYTLFGIASEVGFNSKSTFNSTFKKHMGTTPQKYRKNYLLDKQISTD